MSDQSRSGQSLTFDEHNRTVSVVTSRPLNLDHGSFNLQGRGSQIDRLRACESRVYECCRASQSKRESFRAHQLAG